MLLVAVAVGGALGAVLRYGVGLGIQNWLGRSFPYATLMINGLGSLIMGFLFAWLVERLALAMEWRGLLLVGLLGAFTTFSTFSLETVTLLEQAAIAKALLYVLGSVLVSVSACWLGLTLGRL